MTTNNREEIQKSIYLFIYFLVIYLILSPFIMHINIFPPSHFFADIMDTYLLCIVSDVKIRSEYIFFNVLFLIIILSVSVIHSHSRLSFHFFASEIKLYFEIC